MQWKDIVEALVSIGEYNLAESVCTQQGQEIIPPVNVGDIMRNSVFACLYQKQVFHTRFITSLFSFILLFVCIHINVCHLNIVQQNQPQEKVRVLCQWVHSLACWTGSSVLWKLWASIQKVKIVFSFLITLLLLDPVSLLCQSEPEDYIIIIASDSIS